MTERPASPVIAESYFNQRNNLGSKSQPLPSTGITMKSKAFIKGSSCLATLGWRMTQGRCPHGFTNHRSPQPVLALW